MRVYKEKSNAHPLVHTKYKKISNLIFLLLLHCNYSLFIQIKCINLSNF